MNRFSTARQTVPWGAICRSRNMWFIALAYCCFFFFFLEWVIGPAWAVPMDVGGPFSGTVTGVMVMAGALAASLTPLVYGGLFDQGFWVAPFFVSAGVLVAGAVVWTFLIDPERSVVNPT